MIFLVYLVMINIITLGVWISDKVRARSNQWRVREKMLYGLIVLGGGPGALIGIAFIRHKSRHMKFWIAAIAGTLIYALLFIKFYRLLTIR